VAVRDGSCEFWGRHLERLLSGCERLRITPPDPDRLAAETRQIIQGARRAVLKILITRGSGGRGYRVPESARPTRILRLMEWPDHPAAYAEQGVRVRLCAQRLGGNSALAGLKHLNRLEQVLARMEWDDTETAEGLLMDHAGQIIEGTFTNVFMVGNGALLTPRLDQCGVAGVLRGLVMELAAAEQITCEETELTPEALYGAEEIFLTNSLIGIWPVREFELWEKSVGPVTRTLQAAVERLRQTGS
jgi:4-amino-4-deoxychorismate lyase